MNQNHGIAMQPLVTRHLRLSILWDSKRISTHRRSSPPKNQMNETNRHSALEISDLGPLALRALCQGAIGVSRRKLTIYQYQKTTRWSMTLIRSQFELALLRQKAKFKYDTRSLKTPLVVLLMDIGMWLLQLGVCCCRCLHSVTAVAAHLVISNSVLHAAA